MVVELSLRTNKMPVNRSIGTQVIWIATLTYFSISQCFNLSLTHRRIGLYRVVMISAILECMLVEAVVSSMTKSMSYEEKLPLKIKCHDVYLNKR
jgi:hypothetical protein